MNESRAEGLVRAHIMVSGLVQGVGYRAFAARVAGNHRLVGGVRNLNDGRVEVDVEGEKAVIQALVVELKAGPPGSDVQKIEIEWSPSTNRFSSFRIWY